MGTASNVVIFARIWRGQPISNVLSQLVTCKTDSIQVRNRDMKLLRTFYLAHVHYAPVNEDFRTKSKSKNITVDTDEPDAPRDCRIPSVGALPSARLDFRTTQVNK